MTTKHILKHVASAAVLTAVLVPVAVFAQGANDPYGIGVGEGTLGERQDIRVVIANIIKTAMSFLGIVAVLIVLYGGFKWMTAGGNEEQVGEAKKILIAGVIGLIIIILAYTIASFVVTQLVSATSGT